MIQFIRKLFASKLGLAITFAFIGLIALAFASSDVANTGTFGGVSGADRVAVVGDTKIGTAELNTRMQSVLTQIREENPTLTMAGFVQNKGMDQVLDQLIDRVAISAYARKYGLRAGDNLVNSEIIQLPAFRGPNGNFSQDIYQQALRQQGLTDALVRGDFADGLLAQQLLQPAMLATKFPDAVARRYAALLKERRQGSIGFIPSGAFAPTGDPTNKQLADFYDKNRGQYIRPERRVIRYATFGIDSLKTNIEPSTAEVAARYQRDAAQYAASESRTVTQLIVPTQQAANALRDRINAGTPMAAAAREAGFSTATIGPVTREELARQTDAKVAAAIFSTAQGKVAEPARGALGWYVVRVDNVTAVAARTLAQATPEITEQLRIEKRNAAFADLSARVEEEIDGGAPLSQMADELGVEITTAPALTADGRVYGNPQATMPPPLAGALNTAFQMEEGEPQLAELVRGTTYLIFEVSDIAPSATAPLNEIKEQVTVAWRLSEGSRLAKAAAEKVIGALGKGKSLSSAIGDVGKPMPPVDQISMTRRDLTQFGAQMPPPLALMFSMAKGTSKKLEAANNLGWFIVDLNQIVVEDVASDDELVAPTKAQLESALADEYTEQLTMAMRAELGVERNESAIAAIRKQLVGDN